METVENYCEACGETFESKGYRRRCIECDDCYYCDGKGWGIIGVDWDSPDPINGPYYGDRMRCPCCYGSGRKADETFW